MIGSAEAVAELIQTITASFRGLPLWVALSEPMGPPEAEFPLLPEHLRFLIEWEKSGTLFAAGPFVENGRPGQRSLYIVRADSLEEATAIIAEEPFHKRGMRTFTVQEWQLSLGNTDM